MTDVADENLRTTLSLKIAYVFGTEHGLKREVEEIRNMEIEWDKSYTSSLRRGYVVDLFEQRGLLDEFKARHWPFGNTADGERKRLRYLRIKHQYEDFLAGRGGSDEGDEEKPEDEEP